jgi:hypothetical protein
MIILVILAVVGIAAFFVYNTNEGESIRDEVRDTTRDAAEGTKDAARDLTE